MEALATITSGAVTGSTSDVGVVSAPNVSVTGTSVAGKLGELLADVPLMLLAVFFLAAHRSSNRYANRLLCAADL